MTEDKIIRVITKILANSDRIEKVVKQYDEYYFEFPEGVFWSAKEWQDSDTGETVRSLYLYPQFQGTVEEAAQVQWGIPTEDNPFLSYSTKQIKDGGFEEKVTKLVTMLQGKFYGTDEIFRKVLDA